MKLRLIFIIGEGEKPTFILVLLKYEFPQNIFYRRMHTKIQNFECIFLNDHFNIPFDFFLIFISARTQTKIVKLNNQRINNKYIHLKNGMLNIRRKLYTVLTG